MECIRLKQKIRSVPARDAGCRIQFPGTYGVHETNKKFPSVLAGVAECRIQVPWTYGPHHTKNNKFLVYTKGCKVQNSGCLDIWSASH